MRRRNAFRRWTDWFHAFVGFVVVVLARLGYWLTGLIILLVFVVYQSLEAESVEDSYYDLCEMLVGALFGYLFSFCF
jgi:hypothetical protein